MRRAIATSVALGALCAVLLSGCGRAADRRTPPVPPVPASSTATTDTVANGVGSGGTGRSAHSADDQIASTDGLLGELDTQVNTDAQPAQDAD